MSRVLIAATLSILFMGCGASMNSSLTPSPKLTVDSFDNKKIIHQTPVSSASSFSEAFHTLGFRWKESNPEVVYMIAGISGIDNVMGLVFNVDGDIIKTKPAQFSTSFDTNEFADRSTKAFSISLEDFKRVAAGKSVKMKVEQIDTYSVSSFGPAHPATVDIKFQEFLLLLNKVLSDS